MKQIRLTDPQDERLTQLWALMERAFPREERRDAAWHRAAMGDADFHGDMLYEGADFIGLATYWRHEPFLYLEHLAIEEAHRGQGYGGRLLQALIRQYPDTVIVAEVEPPVNELTRRRCAFYERNGFRLLSTEHVQLPYHPDTPPVPLHLYVHAARSAEDCLALLPRFERFLHDEVMRYRDPQCGQ